MGYNACYRTWQKIQEMLSGLVDFKNAGELKL